MIKKKYIIKYSFEFIVIVLGISVSFWLNELSIENQNEGERIKVLNSLKMEINEIRDYTYEREKTWVTDLRLLNELLFPRNGVIDTDSILKITTAKSRIETFLVIFTLCFEFINSTSELSISFIDSPRYIFGTELKGRYDLSFAS